jgi:hypothetical protein
MKSPSKYCTLAQLQRIRENNYLGENMITEYVPEEVDDLIYQKMAKIDEQRQKRLEAEIYDMEKISIDNNR